jgi:hypothetical protein
MFGPLVLMCPRTMSIIAQSSFMSFVLQLLALMIGFLIGLWYTAMLVLPLFYGLPKATLGYFRKELLLRAVVPYLIAPIALILFVTLVLFIMAIFWERGFRFILESGGFNAGQALGSIFLVTKVIFSRKTRAGLKAEFDEFVLPYKRHEQNF